MLAEAADLRIVARGGVGYDSVDTNAAQEFGIRVANTPGVNHHAVAELALALMLNCAKNLSDVISGVNAGQWPRTAGTELRGKTLGVIGYGPSGKAIAAIGAALRQKSSSALPTPIPRRTRASDSPTSTPSSRSPTISLPTPERPAPR